MALPASAPTALVTGGSRGIGRAICRYLAADGFRVFVNYRADASAAEETCNAIRTSGGMAEPVQADVTSESQVRNLFGVVRDRAGSLDVLINNAGRLQEALLSLTRPDVLEDLFKANVLGAFLCSKAAIRAMLPRKSGCIVNVSSLAALRLPVGLGAYAISKAALNALTTALARETAAYGIRVNAVAPSYVDTEMLAASHSRAGDKDIKLLAPEEVARVVGGIVRSDFSCMSGQVVALDGGRSGW